MLSPLTNIAQCWATGWEGPPGADLPRNTRLRWVEGTARLLTLRLYQLAAGIFTSSFIPLPSRQDTLMWVSELPSPSTMKDKKLGWLKRVLRTRSVRPLLGEAEGERPGPTLAATAYREGVPFHSD